ncbi:MAG: hypothetical protein HY689_06420 [Chloroflexi bacterium]|nr:hypothetical protein [Chloroflexota bacterium]
MGSRRGGNILMALGVVLAIIGGGIAFVLSQTAVSRASQVEVPKRPVVLARLNISEGTVITSDKVEIIQWPENLIPSGTVTDSKDLEGKFARVPIGARTPLNISQLAGRDLQQLPLHTAAGEAPAKVPDVVQPEFLLEKGQVLVAVNYPSAGELIKAGALKAGSRVDIVVRAPGVNGEQLRPVFRNIQVRGVGSALPGQEAAGGSLIFTVPPQEALILKFLESLNPFLLLRAAGDSENIAVELVTLDYIITRFGLQRPTGSGAGAPFTP